MKCTPNDAIYTSNPPQYKCKRCGNFFYTTGEFPECSNPHPDANDLALAYRNKPTPTPHQQSGGLEALIRERQEIFEHNRPKDDSKLYQTHIESEPYWFGYKHFEGGINGRSIHEVVDWARIKAFVEQTARDAYNLGRADRDEEVREEIADCLPITRECASGCGCRYEGEGHEGGCVWQSKEYYEAYELEPLFKVLTQTIEECEARHREEMREAVRAGIDYGGACIDRIQGRMTKAEWRYAADRLLEYSPDDEITSEVSE